MNKLLVINKIYKIILSIMFITNIIIGIIYNISNINVFITTLIFWLLINPLIYLIIVATKEALIIEYNMKKYGLVAAVFIMISGIFILSIFYKLENNMFSSLWYLYYIAICLGFTVPIIITFLIEKKDNKKHINDKSSGPRIIRNSRR